MVGEAMFEFLKFNRAELKKFFFEYDGRAMSMDRTDPIKYDQFRKLPVQTVEKWRQELINNKFKLLDPQSKKYWTICGDLFANIHVSTTFAEINYELLLDKLAIDARQLDKQQRILILELFAGGTRSQEDGVIFSIQKKPVYQKK